MREIAMTDEGLDRTVESARDHPAGVEVPVPAPRRMSAKRKQRTVLRLSKGEPIEPVGLPSDTGRS